jgi:DNA adenine methylase
MKYMGSKARISKEISVIINNAVIEKSAIGYIEPFVGGANMIENIVAPKKYGLDSNEYLIEMWKALQRGWIPPEQITREEYEEIKNNKHDFPKNLVAFAGFVATYNAKWFGGYAGIVNTKIGTKRNYYDEARRNILNQVPKIKDIFFEARDFKNIRLEKIKNYIIYCDPPYENSTKYKDEFNHIEFWEWVRKASAYNLVFISEYNAPQDFVHIWKKEITTTLDKNSRKKDIEKLFVHNSLLGKIKIT